MANCTYEKLIMNTIIKISATAFSIVFFAAIASAEEGVRPHPSPFVEGYEQPGTSEAGTDETALEEGIAYVPSAAKIALLQQIKDAPSVLHMWEVLEKTVDATPKNEVTELWQESWEEVVEVLQDSDTSALTQMLATYLKSGKNAEIGVTPFMIGENGRLDYPSSLRLLALDLIGALNPPMAGSASLPIVETSEDLREIAIGLRNVAWANMPGHKEILRNKARQILNDPIVQKSPPDAAYHLFDIFVYTLDVDALQFLITLQVKKTKSPFSEAAHLAVYKLSQRKPAAVLRFLRNTPEALSDYPLARADLFAMANLIDTEQRRLVEEYLLDHSLSAEELHQFLHVFPNRNIFISRSLLTEHESEMALPYNVRGWGPPVDVMLAQDKQYRDVVSSWLTQSRFEHRKTALGELLNRLQGRIAEMEKNDVG
jgi:hypothetical protein